MNAKVAIVVAGLVLSSAVAAARGKPASKPYAKLAVVPDASRALVNPLDDDPRSTAAGKKLYDRHCATCHGEGGESGKKGPSLRVDEIQTASSGALFWAITNGNVRSGMPVWSKLPEPQRWQIVSYLQTLGAAERPVSGPPEPGPARER